METELKNLREKVAKYERADVEEQIGNQAPAEQRENRVMIVNAISTFQSGHADIRARDENSKRKRRVTREERGGVVRPSMTPVDRKGKVEKEGK